MNEIKQVIQRLAKTSDELYSLVAKVDSVDEIKRVCVVSPINESAQIFDVRLQSSLSATKGIVSIPKKNSYVVVTFLTTNVAFVSLCTEVDKIIIDCDNIVYNGGDNDGLVNINQITTSINSQFTALINAIKVAYTAQSAIDGGLGSTSFNISSAAIIPLNANSYKDTKFKH